MADCWPMTMDWSSAPFRLVRYRENRWSTGTVPVITLGDIPQLRQFAGLDAFEDTIPDDTTILKFRHLLEANALPVALFAEVNAALSQKGRSLRHGTAVDATLIAAPRSTKNKNCKRDPERHQAKKGNQWHFGMKAHIGVDADSGLVHTVLGKAANAIVEIPPIPFQTCPSRLRPLTHLEAHITN